MDGGHGERSESVEVRGCVRQMPRAFNNMTPHTMVGWVCVGWMGVSKQAGVMTGRLVMMDASDTLPRMLSDAAAQKAMST